MGAIAPIACPNEIVDVYYAYEKLIHQILD